MLTDLIPADVEAMTDERITEVLGRVAAKESAAEALWHCQCALELARRQNFALLAFGSETWQHAMEALDDPGAEHDAYVKSPEAKRGAELVKDFRLACANAWLLG